MDWYEMKHWLEEWSGLGLDALHVHAGVLGQLVVAALLRKGLASPWPWLFVLVAAVANEWWDLTYEIWPTRDDQWAESVRDTWNTMLLPTVLMILARFAPDLMVRKRQPKDEPVREIAR
jgi:hypothetical protein